MPLVKNKNKEGSIPKKGRVVKSPTDKPAIVLAQLELYAITGYRKAAYQKRHFDELGVPSKIRPDNTLSVVRAHLLNPPHRAANDAPARRVRTVRKLP
jgi:hypothetical protein